jgi:hypothetical protein
MTTKKNYVNMVCHKQDADAIEKVRKTYSSNARRDPSSVANVTHQMLGALLYCRSHGINYHTVWTENKDGCK